jgi:hypothetical protein
MERPSRAATGPGIDRATARKTEKDRKRFLTPFLLFGRFAGKEMHMSVIY